MPLPEIVATSLMTTAAAQAALWIKHRWSTGREERFSALYLALFFEHFADACARRLQDVEAEEYERGYDFSGLGSMLRLPSFPKDVDWKALGIDLTEKAFAFRVAVQAGGANVEFRTFTNPPDGGDGLLIEELIDRGIEALDLAADLRAAQQLIPSKKGNRNHETVRYLRARSHARRLVEPPSPPASDSRS